MKLKYEDLLFFLAKNGTIILSPKQELIVRASSDSLKVKVSSCLQINQLKLEFSFAGTDIKKIDFIDDKIIKNFLDYSNTVKEKELNSGLIQNYGQVSYDKLKEKLLSVLAGKQNHKIIPNQNNDEFPDFFELNTTEHDLISTITFNQKNINHVQPLVINFHTYLDTLNENDKKSVSPIVLISYNDLDKYEMLKMVSKNEHDVILNLINDEEINSPILKFINIENQLEEKCNLKIKRKI